MRGALCQSGAAVLRARAGRLCWAAAVAMQLVGLRAAAAGVAGLLARKVVTKVAGSSS